MALAVSVVIPTYNRRRRLLACLEHLDRQILAADRFEVIVVSDGSTDATVAAVEERARSSRFALRVMATAHGGPGSARNRGVAEARAPLIAFTDDDVEVEPGWLLAALPHFADPSVGGVEGATIALQGEESLYRGNVSNLEGGIYPTCNMFYRREALDRVGGFDLRFRQAREDSDLAFRVLDSGARIDFEPAARAHHRSFKSSVWLPLSHARGLIDTALLRRKHPGRDALRRLVYPSDLARVALAVGVAFALGLGRPWLAAVLALGFLALVLRILQREVILARALRGGRILPLLVAYSLAPFANLGYLLLGCWRARAIVSANTSS